MTYRVLVHKHRHGSTTPDKVWEFEYPTLKEAAALINRQVARDERLGSRVCDQIRTHGQVLVLRPSATLYKYQIRRED